MKGIDVLIVGAGPAGLAIAIRLKQKLNREKKFLRHISLIKILLG